MQSILLSNSGITNLLLSLQHATVELSQSLRQCSFPPVPSLPTLSDAQPLAPFDIPAELSALRVQKKELEETMQEMEEEAEDMSTAMERMQREHDQLQTRTLSLASQVLMLEKALREGIDLRGNRVFAGIEGILGDATKVDGVETVETVETEETMETMETMETETVETDQGKIVETEKPIESATTEKSEKLENQEMEKLREALEQEKAKNRDYLRQLTDLKDVEPRGMFKNSGTRGGSERTSVGRAAWRALSECRRAGRPTNQRFSRG